MKVEKVSSKIAKLAPVYQVMRKGATDFAVVNSKTQAVVSSFKSATEARQVARDLNRAKHAK